jgi:hypothetical protein
MSRKAVFMSMAAPFMVVLKVMALPSTAALSALCSALTYVNHMSVLATLENQSASRCLGLRT